MSASFNVAGAKNFQFAAATSATGWPIDSPWAETEELTSAGVDNARWRKRRDAFRTWEVDTISGFTSYALAAAEARSYQLISGRTGGLSVVIAGATYNWTNVHAELVSYALTAGPIYGSAVTANSTHQLRASWRFTMTDLTVNP